VGKPRGKTWMLFPRRAAEELQPSAFSQRGLKSIALATCVPHTWFPPIRQIKWCGPQPWSWARAWNIATRESVFSPSETSETIMSRLEKGEY
jgi:hypothetical protein